MIRDCITCSYAQDDDQNSGLTIEQLEQCLGAMERRLEDRINRKIQSMNERLQELASTHASATADHTSRNTRGKRSGADSAESESLENRFATVEKRLESIAEAVGVTPTVNVGDDDEDRKRLKERLKEAQEEDQAKAQSKYTEKETWMEYIFGICKPDGRVGKRGSRFVRARNFTASACADRFDMIDFRLIHPQSRFMQGAFEVSGIHAFRYDSD